MPSRWSGDTDRGLLKYSSNQPVRFSVRAFNKLDELLDEVGAENVTIKIRLQSQPWHLFFRGDSALRAGRLHPAARQRAGAQKSLQAVADHREEFEFTDHCSGPNMNTTPQQIIERLERYSHVSLAAAFCPSGAAKTRSNGTVNTPARTAFMCRRRLWSTARCSPISAAAMTSACGPRGLWPEISC